MAVIGTDFEIQNDKDIRYVGTTDNYTVYAFHVWLQGLADDASAGDDFMDMSRPTPSEKAYYTIITLLNGYNIDAAAAQHLYNGSIIQNNGDEIWDGIQVLAPAGMRLEIIQNGALISPNFWTTGLNADAPNGISHQFMIKVRTGGVDTDGRRLIGITREWQKTFLEFKINGTARGVNVMAFTGWATDLNNQKSESTIEGYSGITNIKEGYSPIDVNNDTVNEYYYSKWNRDKENRLINDFYERMKWLTRRGTAQTIYGLDGILFRGITHEIVVDGQGATNFNEFEPVSWTGGTGQMLAINDVNAATKMWIQLLTGIPPTDDLVITGVTSTATCAVNVTVTERSVSAPFCGQSTGTSIIGSYGFGVQALDLSSSDKVFDLSNNPYQAPNYVTFTVGGLANGEDYVLVAPRGYRFFYDTEAVSSFIVGETLTFTNPAGTAILADILDLGNYGEMYIGPILTGAVPQNNSTITGGTSNATALVNGAVFDDINLRQLTLNGALTGATVIYVIVNEDIPADTPGTGTIRIKRTSGKYTSHPYSIWSPALKRFTITQYDFSGDYAPDGGQVYVSYIDVLCNADTESFTSVYDVTRNLFIRVRDGGSTPIKTFETTGVLGLAGGSATVVRTSDA